MQHDFRLARAKAGHSQAQAANMLGVCITTIYKLERYGVIPQQTIIKRAMNKYIKLMNELMNEKENEDARTKANTQSGV